MGCIPSKNVDNKDQNAKLLDPNNKEEGKPHAVTSYHASSSEEGTSNVNVGKRTGSQYYNNMVKQSVQNLIDVPSLAYTLYGTNSPYVYCEDYNDIIRNVKIVDGAMNVSTLPDVDMPDSAYIQVMKPSKIDYVKISKCRELLGKNVDSMKISSDSIVVSF